MRMTRRVRIFAWVAGSGLGLMLVASALWVWKFQRYTPAEVMLDVRAAVASKDAPKPVERFLETRYGPLSEPANRQKAFVDFFNPGHIEGLQFIVKHAPEERRQKSIQAMAEWVADYRDTMTADEKRTLSAQFDSKDGREMLQRATAQYLKQDVHYRAATAPVIAELMTTLSSLSKP